MSEKKISDFPSKGSDIAADDLTIIAEYVSPGVYVSKTINGSQLGALKADLVNGLVPANQLPSYVDDVLEFADLGAFPITGETGKIYVSIATNLTYRWTGSVYVEISASSIYTHPNHSGDVTSAGDGATTIAPSAVTYAKIQNVSAASRLLGRKAGVGAGSVQEILLGTGLTLTDDVLSAGGGGGLTIGTTAIASGTTGRILFEGAAVVQQDSDLFWDNTNKRFGIGATAPTNDLSFGNAAARKIWIESTANGTVGRAMTVSGGSTTAGTNNIAGGNYIIQSGAGTGGGASSILFQTGTAIGPATALQNIETKMTILSDGFVGVATVTPRVKLEIIQAAQGAPSLGGATVGGFANLGSNTNFGMYMGADNGSGNSWIQAMANNSSTAYNLILQPIANTGGNVGIGVGVGSATTTIKLTVRGAGTTTGTRALLIENSSAVQGLAVDGANNVSIGQATLATSATDGFAYIPTCAGAPTGTPTAKTGYAPMVIDSTNNKMYIYAGAAWQILN